MVSGTRGNRYDCLRRESSVLSMFTRVRGLASLILFFLSLTYARIRPSALTIISHERRADSRRDSRVPIMLSGLWNLFCFLSLYLVRMQLNFDTTPFEWRVSCFSIKSQIVPARFRPWVYVTFPFISARKQWLVIKNEWRTGFNAVQTEKFYLKIVCVIFINLAKYFTYAILQNICIENKLCFFF